MTDYKVKEQPRSYGITHDVFYRNGVIANIEGTQAKAGLFQKKRFFVTNQPGASDDGFDSLKAAVAHSIDVHRQSLSGEGIEHPAVPIGHLINELSNLLWKAARNPHLPDSESEVFARLMQQHTNTIKTYNDTYGREAD